MYSYFNWIWNKLSCSFIIVMHSTFLPLSSLSTIGQPMTLNGAFLSPLPGKGKLEFDFIGGGRPRADVVVCRSINTSIRHSSYCLTIAGYEWYECRESFPEASRVEEEGCGPGSASTASHEIADRPGLNLCRKHFLWSVARAEHPDLWFVISWLYRLCNIWKLAFCVALQSISTRFMRI